MSQRILSENYESVIAVQIMQESLERQDSGALFALLVLYTIGWMGETVPVPWLQATIRYLSITDHFQEILSGVIDTKDLVYFATLVGVETPTVRKPVDVKPYAIAASTTNPASANTSRGSSSGTTTKSGSGSEIQRAHHSKSSTVTTRSTARISCG